MAKGPNADPTGPPESILVWEGQADDVAPVVETKTPAWGVLITRKHELEGRRTDERPAR